MIQRLFEAILRPIFKLAAALMEGIVIALLGRAENAEDAEIAEDDGSLQIEDAAHEE